MGFQSGSSATPERTAFVHFRKRLDLYMERTNGIDPNGQNDRACLSVESRWLCAGQDTRRKGTMDTLLISTNFFGYPQEIVKALAARGRQALWHDDRPATDTRTKALIRLSPKLMQRRSDEYFARIFADAARHDIQDILVIKGEALSVEMIRKMRSIFPKARLTLYFWDSHRNMPKGSVDKIDLFDRAFSFDLEDTKYDKRLAYRPLFFIEQYADVGDIEQDIDLLFIGTAHSDRVTVLRNIERSIPRGCDFRKILYVRSGLLHRIQKITSFSYRNVEERDFIFTPIPKEEVRKLVGRAKVVLDIERDVQTGFTMRTIEMLGASRKLITTNPSIVKADFYDPQNQCCIDRNRPVIDPAFFDTPWRPQDPALLTHYSLSGWLDEVLG